MRKLNLIMKRSIKALFVTQIIFVAVFLATSAHAQFSGGVKAGANLATEQYPGFTMENAILPYGGAFARYQVSLIAFQLEANYSVEGGNLRTITGEVNKYRESYINVPLFIQGRFPLGQYIELGAQYGFLQSSTYNYNQTGEVNTKGYYKSNNISLGGGVGYEIQKGNVKGLGINLRFMKGLTAISSSGSGDIKTSTVSLGLSQKF